MNIKKDSSPHQHKRTQKITGIVIHTTVGNYQGTISWFKNPTSQVSAHYVVKEDGSEVVQMVGDDAVAYHAGIVSKPTTRVFKGGNPNDYTIGIENADAGKPHDIDRTNQYKTLIRLVADLCTKHSLPCDKDHICGHKEIRSTKTCPGNIDVPYVIAEAKKLLMPNTTYTEEQMTKVREERDTNWNLFQKEMEMRKESEVKAEETRKQLEDEKKNRIQDLETLGNRLMCPADLPSILSKIETLISYEDKALTLEKKLQDERSDYEVKLQMLERRLQEANAQIERLQNQVNDLSSTLQQLKEEKPEPTEPIVIQKPFIARFLSWLKGIL